MPPQSRYRARPRDRRQAMRSLTSLHESRVYSPENFWSPVQKDFCNNICQEPTCGRSAPAICERLFDLEAELIDQCAPLAFLALDVGGVLLRRTGHGPTAIGDQA